MQTTSSTGPDLRTHKSFAESSSQSKTINDKIYDCSKRRKKNKRREKSVLFQCEENKASWFEIIKLVGEMDTTSVGLGEIRTMGESSKRKEIKCELFA